MTSPSSIWRRFTADTLRDVSTAYISLTSPLKGTTMPPSPCSVSSPSFTAMKRTPRNGKMRSRYVLVSYILRPKRLKSFTAMQSTAPARTSSMSASNAALPSNVVPVRPLSS